MSINTQGCNLASPYKNMFIYMLRLMVAVAVLLPAKMLAQTAPQATYYVDPTNGNDANGGTSLGSAFQTIEKARDVVRTINGNMTGDIYVYLRGGTYWLTSTLNFTDADSGTNGFNIIYSAYNGEKPVLSGGKKIINWTLHNSCENSCQSIYKADAGNIETRQLYVNGKRATRARGTVPPPGLTFLIDTGYSANGNVFVDNAKPMDQWENQSDIEFTYNCEFAAPRAIVDNIIYDGTTTKINMRNPVWFNATHKGGSSIGMEHNRNGRIWYMENAFELLDAEGEWYLNRTTDSIYYKPRPGEDMTTTEVIAPILEELIRIQGADLDHKVRNIQFKGITFAHATYMRPSIVGGVSDAQNNVLREYLPNNEEFLMGAAVNLKYANSVVFERDVFEHLGGIGMNMYPGSQDNLVVGCRFTDISAGGIAVGDYRGYNDASNENYRLISDPRAILRNNDIFNSYFKTGVEFFSSCAISSSFPVDMDITHNEVAYAPYSGIHIGWGWDSGTASNTKNLKIEKNFIHDVNCILNDGGGIYTNGKSGGNSTVRAGYFNENYVMNVYRPKGYALYNDEAGGAATWYAWKKNVVNYAANWAFQWRNYNNSWDGTYTNVSAAGVNTSNNQVTNTTYVSGNNWPAEAQAIIDNAGLEDDYQDVIPTDNASLHLNENFDAMNEGYAPTAWTINNAGGNGTVTVQGVPTPANKSMQLSKTSTASGTDLVSSHGFAPQVSGTAEVTAMAAQTNADILPVILKAGATNAIEIAFRSTGKIAYKNASGAWVDIQAYTAGTWYNFKIEFDVVPDAYNLYIDSVQKLTNVAFAQSTDALDSLAHQIKAASTGVAHIDNLSVYDGYLARTDISSGKTITGFSSQYNSTSYSIYNINDGNSATSVGWSSVAGSGTRNEWVTIDLGQIYTLNSFSIQGILNEDNVNVKDYVLYGSSTGAFTGEEFVISSGTLPQLLRMARYSAVFTPTTTRFVKFKGTSAYGPYVKVGELSLYGVSTSTDPLPAVTASSTYGGGYAPYNVVDGYVSNTVGEWASKGELNPWVKLTWTQPKTISNIVLYDRINTGDNANSGTLTFSDGSSINVTDIPTNGSAKFIEFPSKTVTWVQFQVTGGSGLNVGLSEMKVNDFPNIAPNATATASSQYSTSFTPSMAKDGIIQSSGSEWASNELNPWFQLNWNQNVTINKIILYDRFVTAGWAPGGTLSFSDGSTITVSGIQNNGRGYTVSFPDKTVTWVKFQVSGGSGSNVGLAEMEVYGILASLPPTSVSLNKTVTGFSSQYNTTGFKAININDGTVGNISSNERGWASVSGSGTRNEWVAIDLGQVYTLDSFTIQNEDGANGRNVKDYVLYGSTTGAFAGEEFVISSGTIPSLTALATYTVSFTPKDARYIKFKGTSSYSSYVIVGELSLFGTLVQTPVVVSLNKTVTGFSSQYDNTGWKATNINDGIVGNTSSNQRGWASVSGSGTRNEWVAIDLGQSYTLSSFVIQNEMGASSPRNVKDYVLYGSATGAFAGEEYVLSSGTIPALASLSSYQVNFTPASARYVKFKGTSSYSSYVIVGELSLYGN